MERTLVICKPDAVERGLIGEIVSRLERKGLRIVAAALRANLERRKQPKPVQPPEQAAEPASKLPKKPPENSA